MKCLVLCLTLLCLSLALDVPSCDSQDYAIVSLYEEDGSLDSTTRVKLCHTDEELSIEWYCYDYEIISTYEKCNDPLYKEDAVEVFIATEGSYPYNYFEFEVSPKGQLFFADITNPSGNCSSFSGRQYPCDPITYSAQMFDKVQWGARISVKLDIIGRGSKLDRFKINLFRIDVFESDETRYLAWHQTGTPTPCFHVPSVFEEIHLI